MPAATIFSASLSLPPAAARARARAITEAARRFAAKHPGVLVDVEVSVGEPRLSGDVELVAPLDVTVRQAALPAVGTFLGTVTVVRCDDGEDVPIYVGAARPVSPAAVAYDAAAHCLRCHACAVVRARNAVYVFEREDGTIQCVGGQCLTRLELGFAPALAALLAEIGEAVDHRDGDGREGGGGRQDGYTADAFLAEVVAEIRAHGWVSRRSSVPEAGIVCTRDAAVGRLMDARAGSRPASAAPSSADRQIVAEVRAWLRTLDLEAEGFLGSLAVLGRTHFWPRAVLGIGAAAVIAYWRHWAEALPTAAALPYAPIRLTKGKRKVVEIEGTFVADVEVVRVVTVDGAYGARTGVTFRDLRTGHDLVWWTAGFMSLPRTKGRLAGSIKAEGLYRGVPQVTVTRCAWTPAPCGEAPADAPAGVPADAPSGEPAVDPFA